MLDTFKARLKAKTKASGVNLSQKRIDAYADRLHKKNPDVSDEAEHDKLIDSLDEMVSFADTAKEDDRVRTLEQKAKQTAPKDEPGDDDDDDSKPDPKTKGDKTPKWAKDLMQEVQSLKAEKAQGTIKSKVAEKLKDKVPESFYAEWALPDKEDGLDDFITKVETKWTGFKQEQVNAGLMSDKAPAGGSGKPAEQALDADIKGWGDKIKKQAEVKEKVKS